MEEKRANSMKEDKETIKKENLKEERVKYKMVK